MAVTARPLITAGYVSNSQTTGYTSTGVRTIIDKYTAYNSDSGAVTLTVNLVASGGSAAATNIVVVKSLSAGETYTFPEVVGHVLEVGGFISEIAGSASKIVRRASGREVTS